MLRAIYSGAEATTDEGRFYFHWEYLNETLKKRKSPWADQVGFYVLGVARPDQSAPVAEAVDRAFKNSLAETLTETEKAFQAGFISMLGDVKGFVVRLSLVIALVILIVTGNAVAGSVRERVTEVAVMKALGFPRETILLLLLSEAVLLAVMGGVVGEPS